MSKQLRFLNCAYTLANATSNMDFDICVHGGQEQTRKWPSLILGEEEFLWPCRGSVTVLPGGRHGIVEAV